MDKFLILPILNRVKLVFLRSEDYLILVEKVEEFSKKFANYTKASLREKLP